MEMGSFAIGFGVGFVIAMILFGSRKRGADLTGPPAALTARAKAMNDTELHAEARRLKAQGQLIDAIKLWRAATGLGLKDSKDAVERL